MDSARYVLAVALNLHKHLLPEIKLSVASTIMATTITTMTTTATKMREVIGKRGKMMTIPITLVMVILAMAMKTMMAMMKKTGPKGTIIGQTQIAKRLTLCRGQTRITCQRMRRTICIGRS